MKFLIQIRTQSSELYGSFYCENSAILLHVYIRTLQSTNDYHHFICKANKLRYVKYVNSPTQSFSQARTIKSPLSFMCSKKYFVDNFIMKRLVLS